MLLREMFSPLGSPKVDNQDIDWIGDLKFFIDNNDSLLNNYFFPAVKKHEKYQDHPEVYKVYINPIRNCLNDYCKQFEIEDVEEKFPSNSIVELAKQIAKEQSSYIKKGDYKK